MSAIYECECDSFEMYEEQDSFEMAEAVPGPGVPPGGLTGQVLKKRSDADYDTEWADESGGGGTSDYTQLSNKPQINGNTLTGNKSGADLGLVNAETGKGLSTNDYTTADKNKLSGIEAQANKTVIDSTLTNAGQAADAKKTGDEISDLKNTLSHKADAIYDTASGDIASFPDGADGLPVKDLTVCIEPVQSGTGDPSPTNVRPISGWTGANVSRTGKNLLDESSIISGYTLSPNGLPTAKSQNRLATGTPISVKGDNVTVSYTTTLNTVLFIYSLFKGDALIERVANKANGSTIALNGADKMYMSWYDTQNSDITSGVVSKCMVSVGSTATDYEPYQGSSLPISWQSSAGTVYGGTLDVTSGVLTVDRATETVDPNKVNDNGITSYGGRQVGLTLSNTRKTPSGVQDTQNEGLLSNLFDTDEPSPQTAWHMTGRIANSNVYFNMGAEINTLELARTWFTNNPTQVSYLLATPQTYQLTPTEVTILLGQNNIWADCGPSTVEYPADTKTYVGNGIGEVENTLNKLGGRVDSTQADIAVVLQDPAQDTFTAGTYVIYNNQLYTVKAGGIPAGTAASSYYPNMLAAVSGGGLNSLKNAEFVLGELINITDHTSANPYVFPSDGYLTVFSGSTAGDGINVYVNNSIFVDSYCFATNNYVTSNLFVRKGMTAYVYSNTGGRGRARFYPLQIQIS